MDKHDIKRKAMAAREAAEEVEPGVHITLRLPTRQEVAVAAARAGVHLEGNETAGLVLMQRQLLVNAVVGWSQGVRLSHLLPGEPDEPLAYDAELVGLLLDAQPKWEDKLADRFRTERSARLARLEAAEKNSVSASPGSLPSTMRPPMPTTPAGTSSSPAPDLLSA